MMEKRPKIAFVGNSAKTMLNFRINLLKNMILFGYDIIVVAPLDTLEDVYRKHRIRFIPIVMDCKGTNPFSDLKYTWSLYKLYKKEKFDFIFHYTIKPIIFGAIAAHLNHIRHISVITGLGYTFLHKGILNRFVTNLYRKALRYSNEVWFLNQDDRQLFLDLGILDRQISKILNGEGIDMDMYPPLPYPSDTSTNFLFIGRVIKDKGIEEYVKAARIIKSKWKNVTFAILGELDEANVRGIKRADIESWESEGLIRYLGVTNDISSYIKNASCIVLPSYREGISRVLLEASSVERPIITTDVPGCRDVVVHEKSGLLCKPRNVESLSETIDYFLRMPYEQRKQMGQYGRLFIQKRFSDAIILEEYRGVFPDLVHPRTIKKVQMNISIVVYNVSMEKICTLINLLRNSEIVKDIFIIDNSEFPLHGLSNLPSVKYICNNHNLGFGKAHNIALRKTIEDKVPYHLVLNPDVMFEPFILTELMEYLEKYKDVASLMPKIFYPNGDIQYLCKLLPTPMDLFGRRFLPKRWMKKRMEYFEMHKSTYNYQMNVPNVSGCFMLLRTSAMRQVGLFDERFFLYMEDVDLARRLHQHYKTVFYPKVTVVHEHMRGSYKSWKLLGIHIISCCRYFNKWGWFFDKERKEINARCIAENIPTSDQRQ